MNIEALQARAAVTEAMYEGAMSAVEGASKIATQVSDQANTVKSEDSGLAMALTRYGDTVEQVGQAISKLLNELSNTWNMWVEASVENEQATAKEVTSIQSNIEDISSEIESIANSANRPTAMPIR